MGEQRRLLRLARWGFPLVAFCGLMANSVLVPRVLQLEFSEAEYVVYVAVMALAAYVSLADGGLQYALTRELSAVHASGDLTQYAAEVRRAGRVFAGVGAAGALISCCGFLIGYPTIVSAWLNADTLNFQVAVGVELAATTVMLAVGGYFAVVCYSTGRLLLGQFVSFASVVPPIAVLVGGLMVTHSLTHALYGHAATLLVVACAVWMATRRLVRGELRGTLPGEPRNTFRELFTGGLAIKFADVLPAAAFPHALSVVAAVHVPVAIPARVFIGGSRMVVQQFLGLLNVHITRRLAGGESSRRLGFAQYRMVATFLTAVHLSAIGFSALLVEVVFRSWLPSHANVVVLYLPGMIAEQALLAASLPSTIMLTALGRLRLLGSVRLLGVFIGLGVFVLLLPLTPEAAFGYGLAASAVPLFMLGLLQEVFVREGFPDRSDLSVLRYLFSGLAAVGTVLYVVHPVVVSTLIVVGGCMLLPRPAVALWRMSSGVSPMNA